LRQGRQSEWAHGCHHGHDEVALLDAGDRGADLDHLAQALVPKHEMVGPVGRRAVGERADLAVGAAHSDLEHADEDVVVGGHRRGFDVRELDALVRWEHGDRLHADSLSRP